MDHGARNGLTLTDPACYTSSILRTEDTRRTVPTTRRVGHIGRITQRLECLSYTEEVGGSNPSSPTSKNRATVRFSSFPWAAALEVGSPQSVSFWRHWRGAGRQIPVKFGARNRVRIRPSPTETRMPPQGCSGAAFWFLRGVEGAGLIRGNRQPGQPDGGFFLSWKRADQCIVRVSFRQTRWRCGGGVR